MYDSGFTDLKNHFYDRWVVNQFNMEKKKAKFLRLTKTVGLLWHYLPWLCILRFVCWLNSYSMCMFFFFFFCQLDKLLMHIVFLKLFLLSDFVSKLIFIITIDSNLSQCLDDTSELMQVFYVLSVQISGTSQLAEQPNSASSLTETWYKIYWKTCIVDPLWSSCLSVIAYHLFVHIGIVKA